jgi:transposase
VRRDGAYEEEAMSNVYVLAIDLAKRSFQVCATECGGAVLFNRSVSRVRLMRLLQAQTPCIVAMEACATSHCWGRFAQSFGHEVRLVPPIYVKPFVRRQKNDAADAAAIAEAALRPNMHCVAVKSAESQARAVAFRTRQCFVGQRTQLINALRGHLAEFGVVVAQGPAHLKQVIALLDEAGASVPESVKEIAHLSRPDRCSHRADRGVDRAAPRRSKAERRDAPPLHRAGRRAGDRRRHHGLRARSEGLLQRPQLRGLARARAEAEIDRRQDAPGRR